MLIKFAYISLNVRLLKKMKQVLVLVLFLLLLSQNCENYRILGICPIPGGSHMVMCGSIMKGLAAKGHEVDVVSHFPLKKPVPRYHDISIRGTLPLYENNISIPLIESQLSSVHKAVIFSLSNLGSYTCKATFNSTAGIELKKTNITYDLVVAHILGSHCMLGFAYYFKVPVVTFTTSSNIPWGGNRFGNPDNPSYILNHFLTYINPLSLLGRIINTVALISTKLMYSTAAKFETSRAREFFGPDLPSLEDLSYRTNLHLTNNHFSMSAAQPTVPNIIEIGGLHLKPPKSLPKHLENSFKLTSKYKGVIYLSMGSMILTETFAPQKLQALFDAFRELPYKVLWKATRQNLSTDLDIPSNIQFEPWLPQLAILCHPNIKLFITHSGLFGTQESTYCGVPRLGIPFFMDQEQNLKTAEANGLAIMVKYDYITKESILKAARNLLENPKYKYNARVASKQFKDRSVSALNTAIYWIEYIIRHKRAPDLRSDATNLPWYRYMLMDVIMVLIAFLCVCITSTYYVIKYIMLL